MTQAAGDGTDHDRTDHGRGWDDGAARRPHPVAYPDRATWPPELSSIRPKRLPDGRAVITGRDLAALLGCTPENLRKMAAAGQLRREADLDQSTRSWYRIEEAARAYLAKFPGRALDPDEPPLPFVAARRDMGTPPGLSPGARLSMPPGPPAETRNGPQPSAASPEPGDKDGLIRALAAALADKEAENKRLRAALADPSRRRGHPLRRHDPKD